DDRHLPSFPTRRSSELRVGTRHPYADRHGGGQGGVIHSHMEGNECPTKSSRNCARRTACSSSAWPPRPWSPAPWRSPAHQTARADRKSTRLNSSHVKIS